MPFFEPKYFERIAVISKIYQMAFYILPVVIILIYLLKRKKPSVITILLGSLYIWNLIVTAVSNADTQTSMLYVQKIVFFALVIDLYSDHMGSLLKMLMLHFELCVYSNFLSLILLPNGLYITQSEVYGVAVKNYVLGWHHLFIVWLFPAVMVAWLYRECFHKNTRCCLLTAAAIATELMFGGSTGLVGVVLLPVFILFPKLKKILTPLKGFIITMLLFVWIVITRTYKFLEPIVVNVLQGDMTFTGRLTIWNNAIEEILRHPIIGHGVLPSGKVSALLGFDAATHCHCHVLQIAFVGGFSALALFLAMYFFSLRKCAKCWNNRTAQICAYAVFVYTVIGITEPFEYALMYLPLILAYHTDKMIVGKRGTGRIRA